MYKIKQLIFLGFCLLAFILFATDARAYQEDMLLDCISSAKENTSLEGISQRSIENYCDCALELIVDQSKDVQESAYKCAVKNFQ